MFKTKLELFDFIADHLLKQNAKSKTSNGECAYRGQHGMSCAVGCILPNEFACGIEGLSAYAVYGYHSPGAYRLMQAYSEVGVKNNWLKMLRRLQIIHDEYNVKDWRLELSALRQEVVEGAV